MARRRPPGTPTRAPPRPSRRPPRRAAPCPVVPRWSGAPGPASPLPPRPAACDFAGGGCLPLSSVFEASELHGEALAQGQGLPVGGQEHLVQAGRELGRPTLLPCRCLPDA